MPSVTHSNPVQYACVRCMASTGNVRSWHRGKLKAEEMERCKEGTKKGNGNVGNRGGRKEMEKLWNRVAWSECRLDCYFCLWGSLY